MTDALPSDLVAFLKADRQLDYDPDRSIIGRIRLKGWYELVVSTILAPDGCQSILDDPYSDLNGHYRIDVVDLVAESEDYNTEGLLCWIVAVQQFGCIDPEHGDVIVFPDLAWTDLAANPLVYLDAQWGHDAAGQRLLPWVHFPFQMSSTDLIIAPYRLQCPFHASTVTIQQTQKPPLFAVMRRRELTDWLANYQAKFPCSGVPVAEDELLCCQECRQAEDEWVQQIDDAIEPIEAVPNEHQWIECPGCGIRFSLKDEHRFVMSNEKRGIGVHLTCGQKIIVATR